MFVLDVFTPPHTLLHQERGYVMSQKQPPFPSPRPELAWLFRACMTLPHHMYVARTKSFHDALNVVSSNT